MKFLTRVVEHLIGLVNRPIKGEKPMKAKKAIMITVLGLIMSLGAMPAASQEKPSDNMQVVIEKIRGRREYAAYRSRS
jgi:hypothetical protein